jgi:hypothetical protein
MYPHLLDLIVDLAPPESLLGLRAVSKRLHARADALLFDHLEVVNLEPPRPTFDTVAHPAGSRLCLPLFDSPPPRSKNARRARFHAYIAERAQRARIIDFREYEFLRTPIHAVPYQPSRVLRYLLNPGVTTFIERGNGFRASQTVSCLDPKAFPDDCFLYHFERLGADEFALHPKLELVVHLLHVPPSSQFSNPRKRFLRLLNYLLNMYDHNPATLVVIGGAEACRVAVGADPDAPPDDFYDALDDAFEQLGRCRTSIDGSIIAAACADWRGRTRFISPEEYRAEVGAAQVALETKERPYDGPPVEYMK